MSPPMELRGHHVAHPQDPQCGAAGALPEARAEELPGVPPAGADRAALGADRSHTRPQLLIQTLRRQVIPGMPALGGIFEVNLTHS